MTVKQAVRVSVSRLLMYPAGGPALSDRIRHNSPLTS
jgi:hypothetical protein